MRRFTGFLFVIASAVSFGAMPIFARIAYRSGVDVTTLLFLRFAIAAPLMAGLMAVRRTPVPRGASLGGLILLGGVGYVGQAFCYFTALTLASASLVALLLYLYPAIVAAAAAVFLKEKLSAQKIAAIALALAGAVLTVGFGGGTTAGIVLAVGGALIYSAYIITGARIMKKTSALPSSAVVITSAALVYAAVACARGPVWPGTAAGWIAVACVAVVSTVIAIGGFFAGMERIGPTNASTLSTVEPAVTVCLAAAFLGEKIAPLTIAGGVLILAAVVVLARLEIRGTQARKQAAAG